MKVQPLKSIVQPLRSSSPSDVTFVDLDGTLIKTDLLHEAVVALLKQSLRQLCRIFLELLGGRAAFKRALTESITPEVKHLPFREEVIKFIKEQRSAGRKVILATATDSRWAQRVADECGFDGVLASDGVVNLKGAAKLQAIRAYCKENGHSDFDYVGDDLADLPIWRAARGIYVVAPSRRLERLLTFSEPVTVLAPRTSRWSALWLVLRPYQWVKNILVFVPLITGHNVLDFPLVVRAFLGFVCFCLCASAAYVLNDLSDTSADRSHPIKRMRPFASGALPILWGGPLTGCLLATAFLVAALTLPVWFVGALALYFAGTCVYSFYAKRVVMLDVMMLAGLYTVRVVAGGLATDLVVSEWLMAFSMFFFVSLAFAKRYSELRRLLHSSTEAPAGRGYLVSDIGLIESAGPASGYIAVLVLALYVDGEQMRLLYQTGWPIWLICPLLMYWIGRIWIYAKRGALSEEPIVFAVRDRASLLVGAMVIALLIAGSYL